MEGSRQRKKEIGRTLYLEIGRRLRGEEEKRVGGNVFNFHYNIILTNFAIDSIFYFFIKKKKGKSIINLLDNNIAKLFQTWVKVRI